MPRRGLGAEFAGEVAQCSKVESLTGLTTDKDKDIISLTIIAEQDDTLITELALQSPDAGRMKKAMCRVSS